MGELLLPLFILALFLMFWGVIFSKAGYSGWLSLLMLIPVVNVVWLEVARLRGQSPSEGPSDEDDELFRKALNLDQRGEWAEAVALYEQIAEKLQGQQESEYAKNCAQQIREKMAQSA